jgi:hypothetical protein
MRGLFIAMILSALGLVSAAYMWAAVLWALIATAALLVTYGVLASKLPTWAASKAEIPSCASRWQR